MSPVRRAVLAALLVFLPSPLLAQEHAHRASPDDRLGTVHFATSCRADLAPRFDRAVALLHSFEFGASLREFGAVAAADSTCAMAHWGLAISRWGNPMAPSLRAAAQLEQGRAAAEAAVRHAANATPRERAFAGAVAQLFADHQRVDQATRVANYERAMAAAVAAHPDDEEARIFHALALVGTASPTDKSYAKQREAGRVLEGLFARHPDHPGLAHYIIHAYDYPALAGKAAEAARRYADIAPSAAHALHMPSHTFTRVGSWDASASSNLRSREAALRTASISEALHATDYAVYAYLQRRRLADAKRLLDSLPPLAARFDVNAVTGAAPGSAGVFALAAIPARWALERRAWREAAALVPSPSAFEWTEAMVHFARALGASRTGRADVARASIDSLAAMRERLVRKNEGYWAEQVAIQHLGARAWLALAEGRRDDALAAMREAADREDATEKAAVTPGPLAPARELLGDMLMELQRPADALVAYRAALRTEPNRYHSLDGARRAAAAAGESAAAAAYARELRALTAAARQGSR